MKNNLFGKWLTIVSLAVAFLFSSCSQVASVIPEPVVKYQLPSVALNVAENVTMTTAKVVTKVVPNDSPTTITLQYMEKGTTWGTAIEKTISSGSDTFSMTADLLSLKSMTDYTIRIVATNKAGQVSSETKFTTAAVSDTDGNYYGAVQIGTQTWMASDLKTTHYRDGSAIPNVVENAAWSQLTTGGMCYYQNDVKNTPLYNWYAATDPRGLAPAGWHVATHADFVALRNFLGGPNVAGGKLKETGTTSWKAPNTGATNIMGFGAKPNNVRAATEEKYGYTNGEYAIWLSIDINFPGSVAYLSYDDPTMETGYVYNKQFGAAVICVKD